VKPVPRHAQVAIDFGRLAGPPLARDRISLFNSGLVTAATYRRDAEHFRASAPEHLRIDLGWGAEWMPWTREVVTRDADGVRYDFEETDEIARVLGDLGVRPYWSYCYVPRALRAPGADWRTLAQDDQPWVDLVVEYARGAAGRGVEIGYHEIYNEPDLRDERTAEPVFFAGDLDDYLSLYRRASRALREAVPGARIGGPALASVARNADWLRPFLDMVVDEELPLDFLSFHHYGTYGAPSALATVVRILDDYPQLDQVELHLNEYNSFTIDYPRGGLQDSYLLAGAFAADLPLLLGTRRLTRTSWAQFLDSGNDNYSGMVDIDGRAKPLFHAYRFFQEMPVDARSVAVSGVPGVGALASADEGRGACLVWNRSTADVEVSVSAFGGHPATSLRLVDSAHPGDAVVAWDGGPFLLERGAVAGLVFGDGEPARTGRRRYRARYDYADRVPGAWTDVDETDGVVRIGSGEATRPIRVGVEVPGTVSEADLGLEVSVVDREGRPAPGTLETATETVAGGTAVWFTLRDAAPHVFARATLDRQDQPRDL